MSDRDTHFLGFSKLLYEELSDTSISLADIESFRQAKYEIIARRAYDLAVHVIHMHSAIETRGTILTPAEVIAKMPDMTYGDEE